MTDQHTREFFAALPQDKITVWPEGEMLDALFEGEKVKVYAYAPNASWPVKFVLQNGTTNMVQVREITLTAPKTLKGMLYNAWWRYPGLIYQSDHYYTTKERALAAIPNDEAGKEHGYRTFNRETGEYGPLVIGGGGE